jgi:hypothetical protein
LSTLPFSTTVIDSESTSLADDVSSDPQRDLEVGVEVMNMDQAVRITMRGMRTSSVPPVIGAGSGAQKSPSNYCTTSCTIPDSGGWLAESLAISSDAV